MGGLGVGFWNIYKYIQRALHKQSRFLLLLFFFFVREKKKKGFFVPYIFFVLSNVFSFMQSNHNVVFPRNQ